MLKKAQKSIFKSKKNLIITAIVIVLIPIIYYAAYYGWTVFSYINNQAIMSPIRELIIKANENLNKDSVVEPKTGDQYFPEARLYLPIQSNQDRLTYTYSSDSESGMIFNISSRLNLSLGATKLYDAQNLEKLFKEVPKYGACTRGVKIHYSQPDELGDGIELKSTITLSNGKTIYMYFDNKCPDLTRVVEQLQNLKPY